MVVVILAHPYPDRSQANRVLIESLAEVPRLEVRSLYDLYPDFAIDIAAEQAALGGAAAVVWQHPIFWYSAPALLKLWFEKVLAPGWAWGPGGNALRGKPCLWAVTTGGDALDYSRDGIHRHPLETFGLVVRQTAEFCGMRWLDPFVLHEARQVDAIELREWGERYRSRVTALAEADGDG